MSEKQPEGVRGQFLLLLCAFPVVALWRSHVLWVLYGWFAVVTLGLPPLTLAQVFGLAVLVGLLIYRRQPADPAVTPAELVGDGLFIPAFALLVGWIAKAFL